MARPLLTGSSLVNFGQDGSMDSPDPVLLGDLPILDIVPATAGVA